MLCLSLDTGLNFYAAHPHPLTLPEVQVADFEILWLKFLDVDIT